MSGPSTPASAPVLPNDFQGVDEMAHRTCSIDECEARHYAKGFCRNHYNTWKRHGDPLWFQRGCGVEPLHITDEVVGGPASKAAA